MVTLPWLSGMGSHFLFKRKTFWRSDYELLNNEGTDTIAALQAKFRWDKFRYEYAVEVQTALYDKDTNLVLPLLLVYCAKYLLGRQA